MRSTSDDGQFSKRPSNVSPHAIRRGSITHHLSNDVPETAVGDRVNGSQQGLEMRSNRWTATEKMAQRKSICSRPAVPSLALTAGFQPN